MANNPTVVIGSLNDEELKKSIDKLVNHVDQQLSYMVSSTKVAVMSMNKSLKSLGDNKIDFGGSADGGASKRAKAQDAETNAVEKTIAARDKQIKKNQETAIYFDQIAAAQQKAVQSQSMSRNSIENINNLRAQLQFIESEKAKAAKNFGSLFAMPYDQQADAIRAKIREITQGVSVANSEQKQVTTSVQQTTKATEQQIQAQQKLTDEQKKSVAEQMKLFYARTMKIPTDQYDMQIAKLERIQAMLERYRRGEMSFSPSQVSGLEKEERTLLHLLGQVNAAQQQTTQTAQRYTEEIRKQAQAIRESAEYKAGKNVLVTTPSGYDAAVNIKDRISIEDKLTEAYQKHIGQKSELDRIEQTDNNVAKERLGTEVAITNEISKRKKYSAPETQVGYDVTRDRLAQIIATRNNIQKNQVVNWDEQTSSIKTLSAALKQYQDAYTKMSAAERNSPFGKQMIADMQVLERSIQSIRREMSRPIDFEFAKNLPANTLEEISYKTQMLRAYAQGINTETVSGQQELTKVMNIVESLGEKAKNLQKTTKQIQQDANSTKFDKISQMPTDSIKQVGQKIKEVRQYISELKSQPIVDEKNLRLAESLFDRLIKQAQKLNSVQGTDKNVNSALKQQANTLDEISQKMQRLQAIRSHLNIETQKSQIDRINAALAELKKQQDGVLQRNQQMIASNTALGRSWNYMKNRLAFYFTVGASTQFVKQLIDIRGQYELLDRSIGILIDSAQNGSQIFAELNAMAIKSPFTTMELGAAAKQLVAYDVAAKDVVDTTRRLADMAAAVGIPIERLTYALGQIKAYGYLNARDARMFANAGIPLVKELADYYTELEGRLVSTADVYDRIKKKAIDYNDVMSVVNKMTDEGGKFFDFQEKAADTLKVRIANLALAWNNMLNEMGKDNQGILTEGLKVTKQIFESWRDINNMIVALGLTYGTIKAAQIAYYLWVMRTEKAVGAWSKIINAIDYVFNAKIANVINSLKTSLVGFFTNPAAILTVAFTALSIALTKAYLDYRDLQAANEEFNKSVVKNAEENVKSIDKFFGDYKKQLESVGSLNSADQTKLWERVQEEIEKTTKNAEKYIEILNKIPEISKRIEMGEEVLEQSKRIQDELKRMAERGEFNIGGGFANDSAAKDLQQYSDIVNELIRKYGTLDEAKKEALKVNEITLENGETIKQYTGEYTKFQRAQIEAEKELQNIVSTLDKVNIAEVLGSGDMDTQLANVRSFAVAWRDAFLATEKGSKISAEGQALLNSYIDKWVEQQARVNHLIKDENTAAVEANRTAWETFFKFLNTEERKRLDVAIKTNQLGSKSVQELWDNAAERMQEKATTSYNLIQQQIADLRNTPDVVINVVYRNNKEVLEKDQERFEERYIQPKGWGALSTDEYLKQEKANREKYGTLMRKQGEDTAEYEKRISDERKKNLELSEKNGKVIEENKNKTSKYSIAVTELADKEKKAADDRLKVIKEIEKDSGYDFSTKSERASARKAAKQAESELAKALKDELSTIDKVRSIYKDLTKEGMSHADAVERATRGWDETVNAINRVLQKNGLQKLDLSKFAGIKNPRELVNMLQSQLNTLLKRGAKPAEIKELQTKINTLWVDVDKYDLDMITKGLNNELGKLKDEYELAVELDADPELGNAFADMMGINAESLPHTVKEYADEYSKYLNKYLKGKNSSLQFTGDELRGLTRDDINALQSQVGAGTFNQEWFDAIKKAYEDISGKRKKDLEETEKWKNSLIEKYGNLQDKLTKIYKDSVQNQVNAVKTFSKDEDQKSEIVRLQLRLEETDNPAELAEINTEIAKIVKDVTDKNPIALKLITASDNQTKVDTSKAYWEDFKGSDLYTMTFEDMANNSTRAIQLIIDKLNNLKNDVKEDPASMKALIKSLEDAEKELNARDPFGGIARSLRDMSAASQETKTAQEALWRAEVDVEQAQQEVDNAEDGTPEEQASAQQKLADAVQRRAAAQVKLTQAENKGKKAQENLKSSLQGITGELGNVKSLFDTVSSLFRAGGDNETADAIDAISEGFNTMTTVIMGVVTAMVLLKSSQPWLLAIAAALSVVVGLVSFLSGQKNKKIDEEIKDSELAVKRLENAYKELQVAVEEAYGTMKYGAEQAAIANKKMQLEEKKRQLQLEKSRGSKDYDEDKIESLKGEIIDLEQEIKKATKDIINDMLGITSVGDAAEQMVSSMIDAFRSGEDYMAEYSNSFEDMIDNMIMKSIVSRVIGEKLEQLWDSIEQKAKERGEASKAEIERQQKAASDYDSVIEYYENLLDIADNNPLADVHMSREEIVAMIEKYKKEREKALANMSAAEQSYSDAIAPTPADVEGIRNTADGWKSGVEEEFKAWMDAFGISFGDRSDKNLSNLQQGIQGITEDTAGALEAITNGISQQSYLQSDLLTQIRDAVVGFDMDVQVATQAQMLLQLQQSYAVQMAIQGILEGVLNPSGRAFSVELVS